MSPRTLTEIHDEILAAGVTVETPWSRWEKIKYKLTGRVSERIYMERMVGVQRDELLRDVLIAEYRAAQSRRP